MATVTNSNNRLTDADTTTGWASDGGGGAGPQVEPDLGYQLTSGSNLAVSRKVGASKGGHLYTHGSTVDMSAEANQVVMCKAVWYNSINAAAYPSCTLKVGNSSSVYKEYAVIDNGTQGDLNADPKRLTYLVPIDPNVLEWPDLIGGSPDLTTIDAFGIQGQFGGSAKAENVAMDAIDLVRGVGVLWLVGSASTFASFVAHDEGTVANRFGHISTVRPGVLEVFGKLWIGRTETPTATATAFADSALTILFGKGFYAAGWTGIGVDLGSASTAVTFTDLFLKGQGQNGAKLYFDTISSINATLDTVAMAPLPIPNFIDAVPLRYSKEGGTDAIGLTDGALIWAQEVGGNTIRFYATRDNARTSTSLINLSAGATGESHSVRRSPDIRPDLEIVGTAGTFAAIRTTFDGWRNMTLTTAATFTSCIFRSCELIDMTTNNGGSLQSCSMSGQTTVPGTALIKTNTTANIDNCDFTISGDETGHAIEVDTAGSYNLDGNTLTGYWASPSNALGATFHTITGVGSNTITTAGLHGFTTGDAVYYNKSGGTDAIGLTDGVRYFARVGTTTTFGLYRSRAAALANVRVITLSDGSTGETHTFYSAKAAVVNTSGGAVTLTVGGGGTAPSMRNVGAATTTLILSPVTTLITVRDNTATVLQDARVLIESADGTGDLPYRVTVTITASGTLATVTHNGHGLNNGDKVVIRYAAEDPYNGVFAITGVTANTYQYTMTQGSPASPATIRTGKAAIISSGVVIHGVTDSGGQISASRAFSVDQNVKGIIAKATASPYFKADNFTDVVDSAAGLTKSVTLILDE